MAESGLINGSFCLGLDVNPMICKVNPFVMVGSSRIIFFYLVAAVQQVLLL